VLFRLGDSNKTLDALLSYIPKQVGPNQAIKNTSINVNDLLPASKAYYRFMGSLTATPCTEGVEWVVLKEPIAISAEQLMIYKKSFSDNARAPQPVNQRPILESM
jgi:carbonic anhydrase